MENVFFQRTGLLLGEDTVDALAACRVIIFGVGGVGSWCAEGLIRSGVGHLMLVDFDRVNATNVNRQLVATSQTIGELKVEVLRARLLEINPAAVVEVLPLRYTEETARLFRLESYDYIVDAIDSLDCKASLIRRACQTDAVLLSSMGAALKLDPSRVSVAEFWKVKGCPLARALRSRFKKSGDYPAKKFQCVYSDELLKNVEQQQMEGGRANGSLVHITAVFGFTLVSLLVRDVWTKTSII